MDVLNAVKAAAAARRAAVVLPETDEPRIRQAAARLEAEGLARPVFLPEGPPGEEEIAAVLAARPGIEPARARRPAGQAALSGGGNSGRGAGRCAGGRGHGAHGAGDRGGLDDHRRSAGPWRCRRASS